jgi:hypothetical protein
MLSERPNVRVHNDPLRMPPARESRLQSGRETQGRLSWGYPFFAAKERVRKKSFLISGCRIGVRHKRQAVDALRGVTLGLMIQIRFWGCLIAG